MSDISKCKGEGCPVRDSCKRFTFPSSQYQSYIVETPGEWLSPEGQEQKWKCDLYWGEAQEAILENLKK